MDLTSSEGTNLSGNYWDNYDEISEGANDNDSDGIADNPYTIYASNTDNGPLLDTIKPHIGTPQASPSSQTLREIHQHLCYHHR